MALIKRNGPDVVTERCCMADVPIKLGNCKNLVKLATKHVPMERRDFYVDLKHEGQIQGRDTDIAEESENGLHYAY